MGAPPRRPAAWAFAEEAGAFDELALAPADEHHLGRVLRLRAGEAVTVSDGHGRWRPCAVAAPAGAGPLRLEPAGDVVVEPRPLPPVTVGFALVKGERPELVVQKLTELGVDRIVPLAAARSVVRWDDTKSDRNAARLRAVAREAAMQSRRAWLPLVSAAAPVANLAAEEGAALCEQGAEAPPTLLTPTVLVGPEGGWDDAELDAATATVGLGPTTLRSETAAIAAGALLCALRSGLVRSR